MTNDEAEKLARTCLERLNNGRHIADVEIRYLCDHILSGNMKREIENAAYERAMEKIRSDCPMCVDGHADHGNSPDECEYCGRPRESIRSIQRSRGRGMIYHYFRLTNGDWWPYQGCAWHMLPTNERLATRRKLYAWQP